MKVSIFNLNLHLLKFGVRRIKHYLPRRVHILNEDDFDRRVELCENILNLESETEDFFDRIVWSDEAKFHLDNSVTCVLESIQSNIKVEHQLNTPGVMVWTIGLLCPAVALYLLFHGQC